MSQRQSIHQKMSAPHIWTVSQVCTDIGSTWICLDALVYDVSQRPDVSFLLQDMIGFGGVSPDIDFNDIASWRPAPQ